MGDNRTSSDLQKIVYDLGGSTEYRSLQTRSAGSESGDPSSIIYAIVTLGASPIAYSALETLREALKAWLDYRKGREVKLTAGELSVHIKGHNDTEEAIKALKELQNLPDEQQDTTE